MKALWSSLLAVSFGAAGWLGAAGCSGEQGPVLTPSPSHASLFGQVDVTLSGDLASLGDIRSVSVGGIAGYNLRADGTSLTVTLQGAPDPGPAAVEVVGSRGRSVHRGVFTYDPPPAGVPLKWAVFGASFSQGTVSLGIDTHTAVWGVAGDVARAAGVYLAPPLFVDGLAPPLLPSDFNADCTSKSGSTGLDISKLVKNLSGTLTDPATGLFDLKRGRVDWSLPPRDVAVGGSKVADVLTGGSFYVAMLEHIIEDPTVASGDAFSKMDVSQIDRLEKLDPDVAFTSDLLGNDIDMSVVQADDLHPEMITPVSSVQPMLQQMMARLGALHGQYFIANAPSLALVPNVTVLRQKLVAAGKDTAAFDAKAQQITDITNGYDDALTQAMAPYPNLHLIEFKAEVQMQLGGVRVGEEWLDGQRFGGLFSLDGLHLTDTAYALYANLIIDTINGVLNTQIPHTDVEMIHAQDTNAPSVLRAAGLTCVPPPR